MKKTMNSKTILKTLAMAMLMPAMLLTTSCSSEDEFVTNTANTENTINKGYALPVTVNVTRQGDGITRATYTDNGNGTGTLGFDTGDQLFILGSEYGDGMPGWFYGTLTWQSVGTFSGTLTTENEYTGTIDAILGSLHAYLLPAGYDSYDFLTVSPGEGWDASVEPDFSKTFADTKAEAIEQFSFELGVHNTISGCIELEPMMAILNFTITGLTPSTEYPVVLNNGSEDIGGNVTTDVSGNATFAVGVLNGLDSQGLTLTVGGTPVALNLDGANNRTLAKGKIYNITRSAASVPAGAINGKFTISDDNGAHTRQVYFSKGNLQAVIASGPTDNYNYTASSWKFADHQWDIIGNNPGNSTFAAGTTVDLFAWVGTTASYDTYGLCTNYDANNVYYGTSTSDNLKSDWGNTMGSGWFTLTKNEWVYLFNTRAASTVNGTENARYAKAYLFGTTHGIILFPDIYTHPDGVEAPTGINNTSSTSWDANQYDATDWAKMEAAGCVFLPAAGTRYYSVNFANSSGYYWSSSPTPSYVYHANYMYFGANALTPQTDGYRFGACSVRLVHE